MTPPALEARGLVKQFGALLVTDNVSFSIQPGARQALIGPNGAGKTTLINLLTGVIEPTGGLVLLEDRNVTALSSSRRVRLGLSRTFQINQLFPHLTPAESLGLAISERNGSGADFWRIAGGRPGIIAEIEDLLTRFGLEAEMDQPTRKLPYGKQRLLEIALALATRPRVLLLDEPAAGVPEEERQDILAALSALPSDVAILLIEHDMDLVFTFATRISVLVAGRLLTEGEPEEIAADERKSACGLSRRGRGMTELLRVESLSSGYGEARVIQGLSFVLEDGRSLALLGRNGVGKTTLVDTLIGVTTRFGGRILLAGEDIASLAPHVRARRGVGWTPQERNIFRSLTVEENLTAVALPGAWTPKRVYGLFPRLEERRSNMGRQLSGGEQQMLAIGRALVLNPRLLLLDEPTEGLAPIIVDAPLGALRELGARRAFDDHRRAEAEEDPALHRPRHRARPRRDRP